MTRSADRLSRTGRYPLGPRTSLIRRRTCRTWPSRAARCGRPGRARRAIPSARTARTARPFSSFRPVLPGEGRRHRASRHPCSAADRRPARAPFPALRPAGRSAACGSRPPPRRDRRPTGRQTAASTPGFTFITRLPFLVIATASSSLVMKPWPRGGGDQQLAARHMHEHGDDVGFRRQVDESCGWLRHCRARPAAWRSPA